MNRVVDMFSPSFIIFPSVFPFNFHLYSPYLYISVYDSPRVQMRQCRQQPFHVRLYLPQSHPHEVVLERVVLEVRQHQRRRHAVPAGDEVEQREGVRAGVAEAILHLALMLDAVAVRGDHEALDGNGRANYEVCSEIRWMNKNCTGIDG